MFGIGKNKTDQFSNGFILEQPLLEIPYGLDWESAKQILPSNYKVVTSGYITLKGVIASGGLKINLGLHFSKHSEKGKLEEFEVFFDDYSDLSKGFRQHQEWLENILGKPHRIQDGEFETELKQCLWNLRNASVQHYVFDRFGPEEHIRFKKK